MVDGDVIPELAYLVLAPYVQYVSAQDFDMWRKHAVAMLAIA